MPRGLAQALVCLSVLGALPTHARAEGLLVGVGETAEIQRLRTYIGFDGQTQTLIESLEFSTTAPRVAWIRAFPSRPEVTDAPIEAFTDLDELATVQRPFRAAIQDDPFGPSLITLFRRALKRRRAQHQPPAPEAAPIDFRYQGAPDALVRFTGPAYSSTITQARELPLPLDRWLAENAIVPSPTEKQALLRYADSGWNLVARVIETRQLGGGAVHGVIGPTRYRFASEAPVHPILTLVGRAQTDIEYEYFVLGPAPYAPAEYDTIWNGEPWEKTAREDDVFVAHYNNRLDMDDHPELHARFGPVPQEAQLVAGRLNIRRAPTRDMQLIPRANSVAIPGKHPRGSFWDLLLTMLMGLAPLFYTPESWFFLWIGARSKLSTGENDPNSLGWMLWPMFAILVGVYWVLTLDGAGRIAGLPPIMVGLIRLARGNRSKSVDQVRVRFQPAVRKSLL